MTVNVTTSAEVWAVMKARHGKELRVFSSFSDPDGLFNGGSGERGRMETEYGFQHSNVPFMGACTTWTINPEKTYERIDEETRYWLCLVKSEAENDR